ncbi:hypothetical protein SEEH4316_12557, partial [Salmonella enterica subsp. enterica serovar Heidelberg str. RI-11-014316]
RLDLEAKGNYTSRKSADHVVAE